MKIAIYPGSFDPISNGHMDIIKRGCAYFDTPSYWYSRLLNGSQLTTHCSSLMERWWTSFRSAHKWWQGEARLHDGRWGRKLERSSVHPGGCIRAGRRMWYGHSRPGRPPVCQDHSMKMPYMRQAIWHRRGWWGCC